jgi:hypothetical protein
MVSPWISLCKKTRLDPEVVESAAGAEGGTPTTGAAERRRGRSRSEQVQAAIIRATNRLLATGKVRELTIEAVAREAGRWQTDDLQPSLADQDRGRRPTACAGWWLAATRSCATAPG